MQRVAGLVPILVIFATNNVQKVAGGEREVVRRFGGSGVVVKSADNLRWNMLARVERKWGTFRAVYLFWRNNGYGVFVRDVDGLEGVMLVDALVGSSELGRRSDISRQHFKDEMYCGCARGVC